MSASGTPRPLRILQVTHQGDFGGSTNSITNLSNGLARRGHEVFLLVRPQSLLACRFAEGPARVIPFGFPRPSIRGAAALPRIALDRGIDLVNCHASRDRYMAIWSRLLFGLKPRIVLTRRNLPLSTAGRLQARLVMSGSDRLIAVSARVKGRLVENGIRGDHVSVVHNGIPIEPIDAIDPREIEEAGRELSLPPDRFVVGVVARLKEQQVLLEALRELPGEITVVFLGIDGESGVAVRAREMGLAQKLLFLGFRDRPLPFYRLFSVMVLPSSIEGFSLAILEAMASRVPAVATDAGGNSEAIAEGETGFLFPPGDSARLASALRLLYADRGRARRMGERARERVIAEFTIEKTVERTERIYTELVFGNAGAAASARGG